VRSAAPGCLRNEGRRRADRQARYEVAANRLGAGHKSVLHLCGAVHVGLEEGRVEPEEARSLFEEAVTVFADPLAAMLEDAVDPERAILVGQSESGRVRLVVFIEQSEDSIRIISARRTTARERRRYEEGDW
jgi:uncharacterized DUF497 family protein